MSRSGISYRTGSCSTSPSGGSTPRDGVFVERLEGNRTLTATDHAIELAKIAATAAADKLGSEIIAYDVSDQLAITDVFLLVAAGNERQVGAVVDGIEEALRAHEAKPLRREGDRERRWVLLDYLELVVHVQHAEERAFYALERLWNDCPTIELGVDVSR